MKRLEKEILKFLSYIANYLQKPEYSIVPIEEFPKYGNRSPRTPTNSPPDVISLVFDAAKGANIPVSEAWNMPIGQAYIAQAMRLIEIGARLDFMDEEEREFQAKIKAHLAAKSNHK